MGAPNLVSVVLHHALFGAAVGALSATALRAASALGSIGTERIVVAAVFLGAMAAGQALLLAPFALGTDPYALTVFALVAWLVGRYSLPRPRLAVWTELIEGWARRRVAERAFLGALAGLLLAYTAWFLWSPSVGGDAMLYHLPEVTAWVHDGRPGSIETLFPPATASGVPVSNALFPGVPAGNYPLTNEVLLSWGAGIARSYVPMSLWTSFTFVVLLAAGWLGLRTCGVRRYPAALATAAVATTPMLAAMQLYTGSNDLPALAWLVAAAALGAASIEQRSLLAPALVAAGLAAGTKTTVLFFLAVVLAFVAWPRRAAPATSRGAVLLGAGTALVIGGTWYIRNLALHGSPLWPFVAAPWDDPVPEGFLRATGTFVQRPAETLARVGAYWLSIFAGGFVLLAGALICALLVRRRSVLTLGVLIAISLLLWVIAPTSGVNSDRALDSTVTANIRFLLPAAAGAALALALVTLAGRWASALATSILMACLALNVAKLTSLGPPVVPPLPELILASGVGGVAGIVLRTLPIPRRIPWAVPAVACVVGGALLAPAASGYLSRYQGPDLMGRGLFDWLSSTPHFTAGADPVAIAPVGLGLLSGDDLRHRVDLIGVSEPCPDVEARTARGWVVLRKDPIYGSPAHRPCFRGRLPAYEDQAFRVFTPTGAGGDRRSAARSGGAGQ